jgi:hypothetical protein
LPATPGTLRGADATLSASFGEYVCRPPVAPWRVFQGRTFPRRRQCPRKILSRGSLAGGPWPDPALSGSTSSPLQQLHHPLAFVFRSRVGSLALGASGCSAQASDGTELPENGGVPNSGSRIQAPSKENLGDGILSGLGVSAYLPIAPGEATARYLARMRLFLGLCSTSARPNASSTGGT